MIKHYVFMFTIMPLLVIMLSLQFPALAQGTFDGAVQVEWLTGSESDRDMRLLNNFTFIDQHNIRWPVPKGFVTDGASIPQAFWSLVGSPFTGKYRRAAVVHDYYCVARTESWEKIHTMFFEAMIAGGVEELLAKVLFQAVYTHGPRWMTIKSQHLEDGGKPIVVPLFTNISPEFEADVRRWIKSTNPTLDEITRRLDNGITVTFAK